MKNSPYFIWDYDISEQDIRRFLTKGSETEKQWAIARIMEHAHFRDVFDYLSLQDIVTYLPKIKIRPVMRQYWQRALITWGYPIHV